MIHACRLHGLTVQSLGITRILIHRFSSLLSAYGLALADRYVFFPWPPVPLL